MSAGEVPASQSDLVMSQAEKEKYEPTNFVLQSKQAHMASGHPDNPIQKCVDKTVTCFS